MQVDGCISMPPERPIWDGYCDFYGDGNSCGDFPRMLRNSLAARSQSSARKVCHSIQRRCSGLGNARSRGGAVRDLVFIGVTIFMFAVMIGYVRFCERMN